MAAKTGTTNEYRDAWIIGFTPDIVAGAWAGNNDNSAMEKRVAGFIVAPLWNAFMQEALVDLPATNFPEPTTPTNTTKPILRGIWQGGTTYRVDKTTGEPATESTPEEHIEERVVISVHSILHWVDRGNPLGAPPSNPASDSQYALWEYPVQQWAVGQNIQEGSEGTTGGDGGNNSPISIQGIEEGATYEENSRISITVIPTENATFQKVDFILNGQFIDSENQEPWETSFVPMHVSSINEKNELRVIVYDSEMNRNERTINFTVRKF